MQNEAPKTGGDKYFCERHLSPQVQMLLPSIFIVLMIHDELVFDTRFQSLVMELGDLKEASIRATPWCCFIGEQKMSMIYEKVLREINKSKWSNDNNTQRPYPLKKE